MNDPTFSPSAPSLRGLLSLRLGRCAATAVLAVAGWLGIAGAAFAANANFTVTITPINADVSVGRSGLTTYAAYQISLENKSGNTTNAIVFGGSTDVTGDLTATGGDAQASAPYVETDLSACTPSGTGVQCNFAQIKNGDSRSFKVVFSAPALAAADHWADNAKVNFNWTFNYSSGNSSGTPSSLFCNSTQAAPPPCFGTTPTNLITTVSDKILSGYTTYIPSFGGTFFTGNGASALPSDPTLTNPLLPTALSKLFVPKDENLTTAEVKQFVDQVGLTGDTTTTNRTYVTVPNNNLLFSKFVTLELRRDVSTHAASAKIDNAAILYSHTAEVTNTNPTDFSPLPACPSNGDPSSLVPPVCILSRTEFTKKNAPTADDIGDWLFIIRASENGGFKN